MTQRRGATSTTAFGVGRRENHDSSSFYSRFTAPVLSDDDLVVQAPDLGAGCLNGDARDMHQLPDSSVALVVTSPPYFVGKDYELEMERDGVPTSYLEYLEMLRDVFAECVRVLEPGGRIAVNVANLGRKPYRSLSADVIRILQDELGLLLRGEVVWQKAEGATGSVAWGSFRRAANPVLRDMTERVIIASKGRFDRARTPAQRLSDGLPSESTITTDEFMEATLDVWRIDAEQASRVGHPAPFPVELPRRLIDLYTYRDDMVLDPFLGSGTTLVAAQRSGRRGVGYDLDPTYVTLAKQRVEEERRRLEEVQPEAWRRRDLTGDSATQGGLFETMEGPTGEGQRAMDHVLTRATASGKKVADIAEALLVEAGLADGFSVRLHTNENPVRPRIAEIIQFEAQQLGIDIEINVSEFGSFIDRILAPERDFDLFILGWAGNVDPNYATYGLFRTGGDNNYVSYSNARVDELLDLGRVLPPGSPESIATYQEIQRLLMADVPFAFINNSEEIGLVQDYVEGWSVHPFASVTYQDLHKVTKSR